MHQIGKSDSLNKKDDSGKKESSFFTIFYSNLPSPFTNFNQYDLLYIFFDIFYIIKSRIFSENPFGRDDMCCESFSLEENLHCVETYCEDLIIYRINEE